MRLSCNGCRVLRKGCSDACTIRPCLQWIKSPDAQANATVFLAKFYGRAGLLNLIAAAPTDALRPAVFRSLLYEACGRIVNPVYGAVGLLWSGTWHMCQAAVEAVLKGAPIVQVSPDDAAAAPPAAAAAYDIRHVFPKPSPSNKQSSPAGCGAPAPPPPQAAAVDAAAAATQSKDDDKVDKQTDRGLLHKVTKPKFKRTSSSPSPLKPKSKATQNNKPHLPAASPVTEHDDDDMMVALVHHGDEEEHAAVHQPSNWKSPRASSDDCDRHSASASLDTEEAASHVSQAVAEPQQDDDQQAEAEQQPPSMGLDLTLGLLTTSATPPMPMAQPTPAACRQGGGSSTVAVDEPAGVIGFRFL